MKSSSRNKIFSIILTFAFFMTPTISDFADMLSDSKQSSEINLSSNVSIYIEETYN